MPTQVTTELVHALALNLAVHPELITATNVDAYNRVRATIDGVGSRFVSNRMVDNQSVFFLPQHFWGKVRDIKELYIDPNHNHSEMGCWEPSIVSIAFEVARAMQKSRLNLTQQAVLASCHAVLEWNRLTLLQAPTSRPRTRKGDVAAYTIAMIAAMGLRGTDAILYMTGDARPILTDCGWRVESY